MLRRLYSGARSNDIPHGHGTSRCDPTRNCHAASFRPANHHRPGGRVAGGAGVGPERDGDQGGPGGYSRCLGHRLRRGHLAGRQLCRDLGGRGGLRAVVRGHVLAAPLHPLRHWRVYSAGRALPTGAELRKPADPAHLARPGWWCIATDVDDRRAAIFAPQRQAVWPGRLCTDGDLRPGAGYTAGRALDRVCRLAMDLLAGRRALPDCHGRRGLWHSPGPAAAGAFQTVQLAWFAAGVSGDLHAGGRYPAGQSPGLVRVEPDQRTAHGWGCCCWWRF